MKGLASSVWGGVRLIDFALAGRWIRGAEEELWKGGLYC